MSMILALIISAVISLLFAGGNELIKKFDITKQTPYKVIGSFAIVAASVAAAIVFQSPYIWVLSFALLVCTVSTWFMEGSNVTGGVALFGLAYAVFGISGYLSGFNVLGIVYAFGILAVVLSLYLIFIKKRVPIPWWPAMIVYIVGLSFMAGSTIVNPVLLPALIAIIISDGVLALGLFYKDFKIREFLGVSSFAFTMLVLPFIDVFAKIWGNL